jgi:hypothetical protein
MASLPPLIFRNEIRASTFHGIEGTAMHTEINVFEKPIERIKNTCALVGIADDFERKLPELETYLESLVAEGETDEDRLTVSGLSFLKGTSG